MTRARFQAICRVLNMKLFHYLNRHPEDNFARKLKSFVRSVAVNDEGRIFSDLQISVFLSYLPSLETLESGRHPSEQYGFQREIWMAAFAVRQTT